MALVATYVVIPFSFISLGKIIQQLLSFIPDLIWYYAYLLHSLLFVLSFFFGSLALAGQNSENFSLFRILQFFVLSVSLIKRLSTLFSTIRVQGCRQHNSQVNRALYEETMTYCFSLIPDKRRFFSLIFLADIFTYISAFVFQVTSDFFLL